MIKEVFKKKKEGKNIPERRDSKYRGFEIGNFTEISKHAKHSRATWNVKSRIIWRGKDEH